MTNKKLGSAFERELAEILYERGWWVHLFIASADGQPADVIAVKNGVSHLIDCKVVSGNYFKLSRMEDNQLSSMGLWEECNNGYGLFAIKIKETGDIYLMLKNECLALNRMRKQINIEDITTYGTPLKEWMEKYD